MKEYRIEVSDDNFMIVDINTGEIIQESSSSIDILDFIIEGNSTIIVK